MLADRALLLSRVELFELEIVVESGAFVELRFEVNGTVKLLDYHFADDEAYPYSLSVDTSLGVSNRAEEGE